MLPYEYELIDKLLENKGLNHLKSKRLYKRKYSEVVAILNLFFNLTEEQKELFMPLLTSNIWQSNFKNVKAIFNIFSNLTEEQKELFMPLLTPTIWSSNPDNVKAIFNIFSNLTEEQKELFMPLLTSTIWSSNPDNVKAIINCKIWENSLYSHLLSKSIWNKSINKIESVIETMEELKIERYITPSCLNLSPIQIKALYHYMQENNISVIISDKLNPLFNIAPSIMLKRYGINLKQLVAKERELENGLSK